MKKLKFGFWVLSFCLLSLNESFAQSIIKDMSVSAEKTTLEMFEDKPMNYLLEIGGPDNYYWKHEVEKTNQIRLSNTQMDGQKFPDGSYTLQVTPIFELTPEQRKTLLNLRSKNDDRGIATFRESNNLPANVEQLVVYFSIQNGKFVVADSKEAKMQIPSYSADWNQDHPALYASVKPNFETSLPNRLVQDATTLSEDDQVFIDDVIVDGSLCVGQDCVNGENFGFDTQRIKENNVRIHFDDTSSSASFPSNDWRISINDSSNGGANYFAVEDATAGTTPLRVMAGAGNNALYVSNSGGNVGMGTASPVVELHVTDGDSPTMRLEQSGASGWTPQTWDIAGNETNFFVRDVTNGSKLPFKIKPGAPDNSLYIDTEGDIGLGTANPGVNALQVESGDVYMKSGNLGVNTLPTVALDVLGAAKITGNTAMTGNLFLREGNMLSFLTASASFRNGTNIPVLHVDAANERVGIGTASPNYQLEITTDEAYKLSGGAWLAASDRRLKKDIKEFTDGLDVVMGIRPVKFHYNGKLGMSDENEYIGVIAQEIQKIAPYTVGALKYDSKDNKKEDYLSYDASALTYLLVNAVQEQQAIIENQQKKIDDLSAEVAQLQTLKTEVAALAELVKSQKKETASENAVGMK